MLSRDPSAFLRTDHLAADLSGRAARGGVLAQAAQVAKAVLELAATLVLARLLAPEEFGLFGMVATLTGFVGLFKDLGLSMATVQRREITADQATALFWVNAGAGLFLAAVTAAVAPALAWFYGEAELVPLTAAVAGAFALGGLGVQHQALLRRQMRFRALVLVELTAVAVGVAGALVLGALGASTWALVAKVLLSSGVGAALAWVACPWLPRRPGRAGGMRELLRFGGDLTGFQLVNYLSRNLDDVLVGRLFGARSLGLYQKAYELLLAPLRLLNAPLGSVAIPLLSRLGDDAERYRRAYLRVLEKVLLITMPLAGLLVVAPDWVTVAVLGPAWKGSAPIVGWLGLAVVTQPFGNSSGWLYISQDRTRDMLTWGFIGGSTAVASFLVGLPWGAVGVAAAYASVGLAVRTPLLLWHVGRRGPVTARDVLRTAWPFAASGAGAAAAVGLLRTAWSPPGPVAGALAAAVAAAAGAVLVLLAVAPGRAALVDLATIAARARQRPAERRDA